MEKSIVMYNKNGTVHSTMELNNENLKHTIGKMTRCILRNGSVKIGFGDPYRTHDMESYDNTIHDYINLWTWDNLDEDKHELIGNDDEKFKQTFEKVRISEIVKVESILYSNPSWGTPLTNKFFEEDGRR